MDLPSEISHHAHLLCEQLALEIFHGDPQIQTSALVALSQINEHTQLHMTSSSTKQHWRLMSDGDINVVDYIKKKKKKKQMKM